MREDINTASIKSNINIWVFIFLYKNKGSNIRIELCMPTPIMYNKIILSLFSLHIKQINA